MKKVNALYLLMLVFHVAHVFEEIWGRFLLIDRIFALNWYLVINWIIFCIPVFFFYHILLGKRWALFMGIIYATGMIVNGAGHIIATLVTGRYFGGFAGGWTGLALIIVGIPLIWYLGQLLGILPSRLGEGGAVHSDSFTEGGGNGL